MNTSPLLQVTDSARPENAQWPIAGLFLDALTRRDFDAMAQCLDPDVRFRALVPPGAFELHGIEDTIAKFRKWFVDRVAGNEFEVVDASIGQVGSRLYLRWRVWVRPCDRPDAPEIVEQHVFATAHERIDSIDLLCSGFQAEGVTSH